MKNITKALSKEYSLKLTGAGVLWLATILKERHAALELALENEPHMGEMIHMRMETNEIMGDVVLDLAARAFGEEFLEGFMSGEIELPMPPDEQRTVN